MASRSGDGDAVAALNSVLHHRQPAAKLGALVALPVIEAGLFDGPRQVQNQALAFASLALTTRAFKQRLATLAGKQGVLYRFFNPPNAVRLANVSNSRWKLKLATKLAGVVMLPNGERALDDMTLTHKAHELDQAQIRSMFDDMDLNKDGALDHDELVALLDQMGLPGSNSSYLRCVDRLPAALSDRVLARAAVYRSICATLVPVGHGQCDVHRQAAAGTACQGTS
jgi:hypothetical protein